MIYHRIIDFCVGTRVDSPKPKTETDEGDGSGPAQLEGFPSSYTRNDQL